MLTDFMLILLSGLSCLAIYAIYKWNLSSDKYILTRYKLPSQGGEVERTTLRKVKPY